MLPPAYVQAAVTRFVSWQPVVAQDASYGSDTCRHPDRLYRPDRRVVVRVRIGFRGGRGVVGEGGGSTARVVVHRRVGHSVYGELTVRRSAFSDRPLTRQLGTHLRRPGYVWSSVVGFREWSADRSWRGPHQPDRSGGDV